MKLTRNTILITGGSTGIGLVLAKTFLEMDNQVIITGRNQKKLQEAEKMHPGLHTIVADMENRQDIQELAKKTEHCNIVINNAGIQYNYQLADEKVDVSMLEQEFHINLIGPTLLIKLMLPNLLKKKSAAIVNVTSGLAIVPKQSAAVYCASKAALHSFTIALRYQLEKTVVKVFEIMPPLVDTQMTHGRGTGKITAQSLVNEFLADFENDKYFSKIGKVKLLVIIQRLWPGLAARILRNS